MMTNGFAAIPRSIMKLPIWEKPPYYFKLLMYLYLNAAYIDSNDIKRGEVIVSISELIKICSSGRGKYKSEPTAKAIRNALKFFCSKDSRLNIECTPKDNSNVAVTFLSYDLMSNSKVARRTIEGTATDSREETTIIYNNINNNNNKLVTSRPKSAFKVKPTAFSNFKAREKNFDEVKQKAKEKLRRSRNEQS